MVNDINVAGVYVPGLLVIALAALFCTLLLVSLFTFNRRYRRLPWRPLMSFSTYIVAFFLLMQGLNALGLVV